MASVIWLVYTGFFFLSWSAAGLVSKGKAETVYLCNNSSDIESYTAIFLFAMSLL